MTPADICAVLAEAGFDHESAQVTVKAREDCWLARLPGHLLAWLPMNDAGALRLRTEARVLDMLVSRCGLPVPRVVFTAASGWQLRRMVPGLCDPWGVYTRARNDRARARRIGRTLGGFLAKQHSCLHADDMADWLPHRVAWPEPMDVLWQRLPRVVDDANLLRQCERVLQRYEALETGSSDRVLVHGDLGFHNVVVDPATDIPVGLFDYEGAAWADRHQDFRYLVFLDGIADEDELDSALEVYEPLVRVRLDRNRIRLCNAACAIGFLAFRFGTSPETRSCGRTLAEDIQRLSQALRILDLV